MSGPSNNQEENSSAASVGNNAAGRMSPILSPEIVIELFASLDNEWDIVSLYSTCTSLRECYDKHAPTIVKRFLERMVEDAATVRLSLMVLGSRDHRPFNREAQVATFFDRYMTSSLENYHIGVISGVRRLELETSMISMPTSTGDWHTWTEGIRCTPSEHRRLKRSLYMIEVCANLFHRTGGRNMEGSSMLDGTGRYVVQAKFPKWKECYWKQFSEGELSQLPVAKVVLEGMLCEAIQQHLKTPQLRRKILPAFAELAGLEVLCSVRGQTFAAETPSIQPSVAAMLEFTDFVGVFRHSEDQVEYVAKGAIPLPKRLPSSGTSRFDADSDTMNDETRCWTWEQWKDFLGVTVDEPHFVRNHLQILDRSSVLGLQRGPQPSVHMDESDESEMS